MAELPNDTPSFDPSTRSRLVVKIGVALSVLTFLAILSAGLLNYNKNKQLILMNLQSQLQLAANTIAISIDGDSYATLRGRATMDTPAYRDVLQILRQFYRANRYLGFDENTMYTFRQVSPDSLEFTVMLQEQYVGNHYRIRPEMRPTLERQQTSFTDIYSDENGMWVSAYAPIVDSAGNTVGMVEVDFRDNIYLMAVNEEIYDVIIFSLAGIGIALLLAVWFSRRLTRPIGAMARAAVAFSRGDMTVSVPVTTRDEIGMLARAFNYMVREVKEKERVRRRNRELQEAYDQLDRLNRKLEEANRLKSEFLSIAVHDLKNPLQVVRGFAERIATRDDLPEAVLASASRIQRGVDRMLRIIGHLLDTTAVEAGQLTLRKMAVDMAELCESVVQNNRPLARRKDQDLDLACDGGCSVEGDPDRLYEVLDNLLSNAIKFSPAGRPIHVSVRKWSQNGRDGTWVRVAVCDQGPGLTAADKERLFGRFMRLSAVPTGGETSTGLGLAVVKDLVELHGGRIWAESDGPRSGSTFTVELPCLAEAGDGAVPE